MTSRTALVIRRITRCEWGTMDQGLMAEVFDRVTVTKTSDRTSSGARFHTCVTADGETFQADDTMVQLDGLDEKSGPEGARRMERTS